jgi:hypothetical protein
MNSTQTTIIEDSELVCSRFSATVTDLQPLIDNVESVTITHGYGDSGVKTVDGLVDSFSVNLGEKDFSMQISGRDYLKKAVETHFTKSYYLIYPVNMTAPVNDFGEPIPYAIGPITAQGVAKEACKLAGLELVWNCPDYPIISNFCICSGFDATVAEVLNTLVSPLKATEMHGIDISASGNTITIKKRKWPAGADCAFTADQLKISSLTLTTEKASSKVRNVYIWRQINSRTGDMPNREDTQKVIEMRDHLGDISYREILISKFDDNGLLSSEKKQIFNRMKLPNQQEDTRATLAQDEQTTFTYEVNQFGSYVKVLTKDSTSLIYDQTPGALPERYKSQEVNALVTYKYDKSDCIEVEETKKSIRQFDSKGKFIKDKAGNDINTIEQTTITYRQLSKDLLEITQRTFQNGTFVGSSTTTGAGSAPPGPQKIAPVIRTLGSSSVRQWKKLEVGTIGKDLELHSDSLSMDQLQQLAQEVKDEQNATKYTLRMNYLPLPQLKKGMTFSAACLLKDGSGQTHDLSGLTFLITSINLVMTDKSYTGNLEAVTWQ